MTTLSKITARRMGYSEEDTYSAIGLVVDGSPVDFALVQQGMGAKQQVVIHDACGADHPSDGTPEVAEYDDFDTAMQRYNEAFRRYLIGKRVRLAETVEVYPTGVFRSGLTGTVASIDGYIIAVKLDEPREELDEWDNELHWNEEGTRDSDGREWPTIEAFLKDVEFPDGDIKQAD